MKVLLAFLVGVVVGIVVLVVSQKVTFLAEYANLLAFVSFVLATYFSWRGNWLVSK